MSLHQHDHENDSEIITRILAGNINAYDELLKKYSACVASVVKNHVPYSSVEEVAQEVFVRAYQALPSFRHESTFKQWLTTIAVRTCYDFSRKRYRSREVEMSSLSERQQEWLNRTISDQSLRSFSDMAAQQEAKETLEWALDALSPEDRIVVELVYFQEYSGKEAAKLLNWSLPKVKMRLLRAKKKLRKLLER